jgi:SAM-dependent methyltransferase
MPDALLYGASRTAAFDALLAWRASTPDLHEFVPDYHRLQLEYWIWQRRLVLGDRVIDVGVDVGHPRRWIGPGYQTLGHDAEDIKGDLLDMPLADNSVDGFVLTEVLEHCTDPKRALCEVWRVLKPNGLLLVTSPFMWPEHDTQNYRDYWRFTRQGWLMLLDRYTDIRMVTCAFTDEGKNAYEILRVFECFGYAELVHATTGYLCEARKPRPITNAPPVHGADVVV